MIYFVTENYIKTITAITKNVDTTDVMPFVATQSDMRIQPILGTYFYDYLLAAYNAQTLTADETDLVEKIQPAIAWRSAEDCAITLSYQLKNKGVQQQYGDYSQAVSQGEVAFISDHYGQKAKFYENRLSWWLIENKLLFAEFISALNTDSDLKPITDCDDDSNTYGNTMIVF